MHLFLESTFTDIINHFEVVPVLQSDNAGVCRSLAIINIQGYVTACSFEAEG
jgi:hypothetical protein